MIAANNILNALYMIVCAGYCAVLLGLGVSVPAVLLSIALLNLAAAAWLLSRQPVYGRRFVAWLLRQPQQS